MEGSKKRIITVAAFLVIAAIVMFIDQFTKQLANAHQVGETFSTLIPGVLQFSLA